MNMVKLSLFFAVLVCGQIIEQMSKDLNTDDVLTLPPTVDSGELPPPWAAGFSLQRRICLVTKKP